MEPQASNPVAPNPETPAAATNIWPGAFGIYKQSKAIVKFNLSPFLLTILLLIVTSLVVGILAASLHLPSFISSLLQYVLESVFTIAGVVVLFSSFDRVKISVPTAVKQSLPLLVPYVLCTIITGVLVVLSFIALIIPAFFVFPRLVLATYLVVRKKLGAIEAIKESWHQTKGNVGKVYGIIGATIAYALLIFTIIGIPFAVYFLIMYSAAYVVLYGFIFEQRTANAAPVVAEAAQPVAAAEPVEPVQSQPEDAAQPEQPTQFPPTTPPQV